MNKVRKKIIENNEVSTLETFILGGYQQKVLIEGKHKELPIVLCLHGGPGMPIPFSVGCRGMFPEFTDKFMMVFWDQLGCGINNCNIDDHFTIDMFVAMTLDLIKELKSLFPNNRLYLFAVSWGSILSAKAVSQNPEMIDGVIVYGQILRELAFNNEVFTALEKSSVSEKDKKKIQKIREKEEYVLTDLKTVTKLIMKYTDGYQNKTEKEAPVGDIIKGLLTSPDYKLKDFIAIIKNGYQKNTSLLSELIKLDITDIILNAKKPYYIIQGDTDIVTSTNTIYEVVTSCNNENLHFDIINNSGHYPSEKGMERIYELLLSMTNTHPVEEGIR